MLPFRFVLFWVSLVWFGLTVLYAEPLRVVNYNVENLFHPAHDSVAGVPTADEEWTQDGERHWTFTRYKRKTENIARVLTVMGEWDGVDVVGLQEVENAACLKRLCYTLRRNEYDFVHYESPDRRGIDVALIYKKARIDTIRTRAISVALQSANLGRYETTRDILYVSARVDKRDTIHFFVCHLPSQRGGYAETQWKREIAKKTLQQAVDSVFALHPQAKIVVMGDMNSAPKDDLTGLTNRMTGVQSERAKGTHKWHGQWTCLDQFYTSPAMDSSSVVRIFDAEWIMEQDDKYMGLKPKRTFNGYRYQDGFSDHLPILLECRR
jgi:endonuclease/exonuclease/phosphatase family metal-dependent hydrolase